ncbi:hypothetical protein KOM00_08155 [Geomonas sp. Red69]|uniref:hypothetical protein n=1 Tax=Geomonas diazotrophica TaxID=2843197 RepID=UPI001C10E48B|nr:MULTISPECIES: hypothetical protein [Geomonas]MBU5636705.1 hypothetical protein [Geomonas diazotrophica]QXE87662.1 hypothetical protein KP003_04470 [Geomonas nitrogeniifigens]
MKRHLIPAVALVALLAAPAGAGSPRAVQQTADSIAATMSSSTSSARKESYQSIHFDGCRLGYTVSGTYPSGGLYTIEFQDLDFSALDVAASKTGQDYTDYVVLRFQNPFSYRSLTDTLSVSTTVINVADREAAQTLLEGFVRLAGQCR